MNEGIRKTLDASNSLELMAWADQMEEEGGEDQALIIRWMATWGRRPRRDIKVTFPPYSIASYYWMTKPMRADSDWFLSIRGSNEHCLPRVGPSTVVRHESISDAYQWALEFLLTGGFAEVLKREP